MCGGIWYVKSAYMCARLFHLYSGIINQTARRRISIPKMELSSNREQQHHYPDNSTATWLEHSSSKRVSQNWCYCCC